jgi:3-dehydroquinate synthase
MKASKVRVALPGRSYDIVVGSGILSRAAKWVRGDRAIIITDSRLRRAAAELSASLRRAGWKTTVLPLQASEKLKNFERIYPLYGKLLEAGADRHSVIFAIGGGVIGDAVGFVAGTYLRGIRWVGVPTTLLAQVDSSIGGKTAVNHPKGKNLIGVFHQPSLVLCDVALLRTLSRRDVVSGLGEAIKYALAFDPAFYRFIQAQWERLCRLDPGTTTRLVRRCAAFKARIVSRDERDLSGIREVLNLGHTIGHALEKVTRYGSFRHGEAIILGLRVAVRISAIRGHLKAGEAARIDAFLASLPVPPIPSRLKSSTILAPIRFDKKVREGRVRFVLLERAGKTILDHGVSRADMVRALEGIRR